MHINYNSDRQRAMEQLRHARALCIQLAHHIAEDFAEENGAHSWFIKEVECALNQAVPHLRNAVCYLAAVDIDILMQGTDDKYEVWAPEPLEDNEPQPNARFYCSECAVELDTQEETP